MLDLIKKAKILIKKADLLIESWVNHMIGELEPDEHEIEPD